MPYERHPAFFTLVSALFCSCLQFRIHNSYFLIALQFLENPSMLVVYLSCRGAPARFVFGSCLPAEKNSERIMKKPFYRWDGDTLVLNILGTPNARRDAVGKVKGHQLCVSVTAAPHAGRATDHMVRFLAEEFGVAVGDIHVVFGRLNVNKQLRVVAPKRLPSFIAQQELL
jgi:uncharacterized protein (TIGR00251 family)